MLYFLKSSFPYSPNNKLQTAALAKFKNLNGLLVLSADTLQTYMNRQATMLNECFPKCRPLMIDRRIISGNTVLSIVEPRAVDSCLQTFTLLPIVGELLETEDRDPVQLWEDKLAHVPNLGELLKKTFVEGYSHE